MPDVSFPGSKLSYDSIAKSKNSDKKHLIFPGSDTQDLSVCRDAESAEFNDRLRRFDVTRQPIGKVSGNIITAFLTDSSQSGLLLHFAVEFGSRHGPVQNRQARPR
jgi:hypothetical protein